MSEFIEYYRTTLNLIIIITRSLNKQSIHSIELAYLWSLPMPKQLHRSKIDSEITTLTQTNKNTIILVFITVWIAQI